MPYPLGHWGSWLTLHLKILRGLNRPETGLNPIQGNLVNTSPKTFQPLRLLRSFSPLGLHSCSPAPGQTARGPGKGVLRAMDSPRMTGEQWGGEMCSGRLVGEALDLKLLSHPPA